MTRAEPKISPLDFILSIELLGVFKSLGEHVSFYSIYNFINPPLGPTPPPYVPANKLFVEMKYFH